MKFHLNAIILDEASMVALSPAISTRAGRRNTRTPIAACFQRPMKSKLVL